jgi:peptide/nickel transport system substrate-binding protein
MAKDIKENGGINRRHMLRLMSASAMAVAGGGWVGTASRAFAAPTPKKGGSIRVAYDTSSTADAQSLNFP